jgi:hypothetical protein
MASPVAHFHRNLSFGRVDLTAEYREKWLCGSIIGFRDAAVLPRTLTDRLYPKHASSELDLAKDAMREIVSFCAIALTLQRSVGETVGNSLGKNAEPTVSALRICNLVKMAPNVNCLYVISLG